MGLGVRDGAADLIEPQLCVLSFHLALYKWHESVFQQIECFADAFVIGDRHCFS